uniref:Reverse transcriptase domain-containing protein n=1 Tax=Chenopodium quinoa TaxID=63459 RepID=A0A803LFX6_CHEQI
AEVKKLLEAGFIEPCQYPEWLANQLVDSTSGHALLSFMDAFSGYHQIFMHPDDRAKTAFVTNAGVFNYKMMPFGLKNAGATYQRLVDQVFADQKGRNMEKLNPKKCVFGVKSG